MVQFNNLTHPQAEDLLHKDTPADIFEVYNAEYNINNKQIDFYQKNGYVKVHSVLSDGALRYAQKVIEAAVLIRKEEDKRTLAEKSQYEQSFLQCGYLCWDFPAVKDFVFGKRFAGLAQQLMKVDQVRLWHDQALFKEAGGRETDVHIDSSYWPLKEPGLSTTMWMALNNVPIHKGSLFFFPESHLQNEHEYVDIFKNPHLPEVLKETKGIPVELKAGDVTFHSGLTYHGAGSNCSDDMREAMTVIYIADGVHFDGSNDRNATHTSCDGLKDGEKIDTRFTPILG